MLIELSPRLMLLPIIPSTTHHPCSSDGLLANNANGYSDLFGDHSGDVWRTVNPLFIGSSRVAAVALWRFRHTAGQVGGVVSAALGALVFANAYFVNNGVVWQILDPVRMLMALAWAAGASQANLATAESGESLGYG